MALIEVRSRKQALLSIEEQRNLVMALSQSELHHLFCLIKGSLFYIQSLCLNQLFAHNNEIDCMAQFREMNKVWVEFLDEIIKTYRKDYMTPCSYDRDLL